MNSLSTLCNSVSEKAAGCPGRGRLQRIPAVIGVLFVGPMDRGSMVHDALLSEPNFHLTIATDCHKLWAIARQESLQVVILYGTLTRLELEDAGRFIHRQWPRARILAVSSGESSLDAALYDGRVAPTAAPKVLLTAIERLAGGLDMKILGSIAGVPERTGTLAAAGALAR